MQRMPSPFQIPLPKKPSRHMLCKTGNWQLVTSNSSITRKGICKSPSVRYEGCVMAIDPLLTLLQQKARYTHTELADLLNLTEQEVAAKVAEYEANGTILGYHSVIDPDLSGNKDVAAFIEVTLTPERGGGFDRLAMRIAKFDQVVSCYLASGGYDLMVVVEGTDLREVARFVSEKLSTINGVLSSATHFRLKTYKESGFLFDIEEPEGRLPVTP